MHSSLPSDLAAIRADVHTVLHQAEAAWRAQDPAELVATLQACNRLLEGLPPEPLPEPLPVPTQDTEHGPASVSPSGFSPASGDAFARERALLWLWRGRLLVAADQPDAVVQGLQSLDQAIARLTATTPNVDEEDATPPLAIAWMNRGSGLFRLRSREALIEGVRSYDEAIALMEGSPRSEPNALGTAWMNRGAGLLHLADDPSDSSASDTTEKSTALTARLDLASVALEKAIAILTPIATEQRAARRNLASTWANLGMLRSHLRNPAAALEAHRHSVDFFRPLVIDGDDSETLELAARLFNLSQAAGAASDLALALESGREALALTSPLSREDPQALQLQLRTRHALCVVLGGLLKPDFTRSASLRPTPEQTTRIQEARELIDAGLALLSEQPSTAAGTSAIGNRLYEFGSWLYRTWQPSALGAFLLAHLNDDPARIQIAASAVQQARQAVMQRGFADVAHGGVEGMLDTLRSLSPVEAQLNTRAS